MVLKEGFDLELKSMRTNYNSIYYNHFHKCMYNYDLLHSILSQAGFEEITKSVYSGYAQCR